MTCTHWDFSETKAELEKSVTALADLEVAPTEVADRSEQRKDDKAQTSRVLKRTLHQQQRMLDGRRRELQAAKRGRGEPLNKRGWGGESRFNDRRGGRFGGGAGGAGMYPPGLGGRAGYGAAGGNSHEVVVLSVCTAYSGFMEPQWHLSSFPLLMDKL